MKIIIYDRQAEWRALALVLVLLQIYVFFFFFFCKLPLANADDAASTAWHLIYLCEEDWAGKS